MSESIYYLRIQNYYLELYMSTGVITQLNTMVEHLFTNLDYFNEYDQNVSTEFTIQVLNTLLTAQENKDYVYSSIAELLEHTDSKYSVEYTSFGYYTIAYNLGATKYYYHSNNDVIIEGLHLANSWYVEDKDNYIVYGLGFCYHIIQLLAIDSNIFVEVYESDQNMIELACAFTDMGDLLYNPKVKIHYDPDFTKLSSRMSMLSEEDELIFHYPSVRNIQDTCIRYFNEKFDRYR